MGVKKSAVAKWENGRVSEIKRSNLKMLASSLNLPVVDLMSDIELYNTLECEFDSSSEHTLIFKSYLRALMRDLKDIEKSIKNRDLDTAERLVENLIEDTKQDILD